MTMNEVPNTQRNMSRPNTVVTQAPKAPAKAWFATVAQICQEQSTRVCETWPKE
jgi:hypothetical protein